MTTDHLPYTKVALVTGAARRIGYSIARFLHQKGMRVVLHYRDSMTEAKALAEELNAIAPDTAKLVQCDLIDTAKLPGLIEASLACWGRLDVIVNNASSFYPTHMGDVTEADWEDLFGSNLKAPFFLSQAAMPHLAKHKGCIVNIIDIKAETPGKHFPVYCIAKAGLLMMTKSLAKELGPDIRVNAVAPGAIIRPELDLLDEPEIERLMLEIPLARMGEPDDIAKTVWFLVNDAPYITGQMIAVDGGRSLMIHGDR
ncbi:MAG: pteridine reductase [Gammaproteobacteria bacterium]